MDIQQLCYCDIVTYYQFFIQVGNTFFYKKGSKHNHIKGKLKRAIKVQILRNISESKSCIDNRNGTFCHANNFLELVTFLLCCNRSLNVLQNLSCCSTEVIAIAILMLGCVQGLTRLSDFLTPTYLGMTLIIRRQERTQSSIR